MIKMITLKISVYSEFWNFVSNIQLNDNVLHAAHKKTLIMQFTIWKERDYVKAIHF